jgi:hypothetical protein
MTSASMAGDVLVIAHASVLLCGSDNPAFSRPKHYRFGRTP